MANSGYWQQPTKLTAPKWIRGLETKCDCTFCTTGFSPRKEPVRFALMESGQFQIYGAFGSLIVTEKTVIRGYAFFLITEEAVQGDEWCRTHLIPTGIEIQAWSPIWSEVSEVLLLQVAERLAERFGLPVSKENKIVPPGPDRGEKIPGWRRPLENLEFWWHEDDPWYWRVF